MKRYGDPKDLNQKYFDRPGAYAIIYSQKKILLTHQLKPLSELQLPGGGIDKYICLCRGENAPIVFLEQP